MEARLRERAKVASGLIKTSQTLPQTGSGPLDFSAFFDCDSIMGRLSKVSTIMFTADPALPVIFLSWSRS